MTISRVTFGVTLFEGVLYVVVVTWWFEKQLFGKEHHSEAPRSIEGVLRGIATMLGSGTYGSL